VSENRKHLERCSRTVLAVIEYNGALSGVAGRSALPPQTLEMPEGYDGTCAALM
jgi:hypothetical protein